MSHYPLRDDEAIRTNPDYQPFIAFSYGANPGSEVLIGNTCEDFTWGQWRISPDGHILNGALAGLVLADDGSNNAVVQSFAVPTSDYQLWTVASGAALGTYTLQNQGSRQYLFVQVTGGQIPIDFALQTGVSQSNPEYLWSVSPSNVLSQITNLPPTPFKTFVDSPGKPEAAVYASMCQHWSGGAVADVRQQYTNPIFDTNLPPQQPSPENISRADWDTAWTAVSDELTWECSSVSKVQKFYGYWFTGISGMLGEQITATQTALSDVDLDVATDSTNVGAIIASVLQSLLYTVLSAASAGVLSKNTSVLISMLANSIQGAIAAAQAATTPIIPPNPVDVTIAELWKQLSNVMTGLDTVLGNAVMQATSNAASLRALSSQLVTPQALALSYDTGGTLATTVQNSQFVSVAQAIMAVKYQIYNPTLEGYQPSADDVKSWAWIGSRYIAEISDNTTFPNQTLLDDLVSYGVNLEDIAAGARGWGLAECSNGQYGDQLCLVRVINATPFPLTVSLGNNDWYALSGTTISPFESQTFQALTSDNSLDVSNVLTVTDQDGDAVASFLVVWNESGIDGEAPTVTTQSVSAGYSIPVPVLNEASVGGLSTYKCFSGSAALTIAYSPTGSISTPHAAAQPAVASK